MDGFFLDGAVAIPHDVETLDGSGQALAVQGVARDFLGLAMVGRLAKTEHSHPLGMVVSTHFRCGKGVKRGLKNGALPFNID